jgi:CRISPR-associated protein Cmr3
MAEYRFLEPIDVLYVRGNRLFGDPGSHGEALMPPWPSLAAGAIRSRMLVDQGVDPAQFVAGSATLPSPLAQSLGNVDRPGTFRIGLFALGRRVGPDVELLLPMPADLIVRGNQVNILQPATLSNALQTSLRLPGAPVLRAAGGGKAEEGLWLGGHALAIYLAGAAPPRVSLVEREEIWKPDLRLGIALDTSVRTALEGHLYTAETVAFRRDRGFVVRVDGADGLVPKDGLLRFGGDGRAAVMAPCAVRMPEPPWDEIARSRRFRVVLLTPGIFPRGWLPVGIRDPVETGRWELFGVRARLVSACVPRAQVVSGWDLAREKPKPAVRAAPAGSVYWFDEMEGPVDGLRRLALDGLWGTDTEDTSRRAEGFNAVLVAAWPPRDRAD